MVHYTSILLPLARSSKKRLEDAAEVRGDTLEGFILAAAEAEATRLARRLAHEGHSIDHPIYSSTLAEPGADGGSRLDRESHVGLQEVASELGWDTDPDDWQDDISLLIATIDTLDAPDHAAAPDGDSQGGGTGSRRGRRTLVADLRLLNPVRGTVVDMSARGVGIETHRPFSVPERTVFSIGQSTCAAKIRAEVRWCLLVRTERINNGDVVPVYRSGLSFLGN